MLSFEASGAFPKLKRGLEPLVELAKEGSLADAGRKERAEVDGFGTALASWLAILDEIRNYSKQNIRGKSAP